ncbi:hypothetical protein C9J01_02510 [Photobacterium rosenbergii]|uniref:Uncharacterized protein n=1 Tax=Photobacterium rosenbergii TaxID=294936 RepID=A0A2T3NKD1_9GAMM|nr:hypothetical protein C9J01_02510 [Photobacterium rosenbergii]
MLHNIIDNRFHWHEIYIVYECKGLAVRGIWDQKSNKSLKKFITTISCFTKLAFYGFFEVSQKLIPNVQVYSSNYIKRLLSKEDIVFWLMGAYYQISSANPK